MDSRSFRLSAEADNRPAPMPVFHDVVRKDPPLDGSDYIMKHEERPASVAPAPTNNTTWEGTARWTMTTPKIASPNWNISWPVNWRACGNERGRPGNALHYTLGVEMHFPHLTPMTGRAVQPVPVAQVPNLAIGLQLTCAVDPADPSHRFVVHWGDI
jgi:hypothetical protein